MNPKYTAVSDATEESFYPVKPAKRVKKSRSCCRACLCVSLSLLAVLILLFIGLGFALYRLLAWEVQWATVDTPVALPIEPIAETERLAFLAQSQGFFGAILADQVPEHDLIVTSTVLNGLIAHSDFLRGHLHVQMLPDQFIVSTSVPTDYLPGGKHRFFVSNDQVQLSTVEWEEGADEFLATKVVTTLDLGKTFPDLDGPMFVGTFLAHITDPEAHRLGLFMDDLVIFNKEIELMPRDKQKDLLEDTYKDPNSAKLLQGLESIRLEQDRIVLVPRGRTTAMQADAADMEQVNPQQQQEYEVDDMIAMQAMDDDNETMEVFKVNKDDDVDEEEEEPTTIRIQTKASDATVNTWHRLRRRGA